MFESAEPDTGLMGMLASLDGGGEGDPQDAAAGMMPVVRPGDASIAAPFTSRAPSVRLSRARCARALSSAGLARACRGVLVCVLVTMSKLSIEQAAGPAPHMFAETAPRLLIRIKTLTQHLPALPQPKLAFLSSQLSLERPGEWPGRDGQIQ